MWIMEAGLARERNWQGGAESAMALEVSLRNFNTGCGSKKKQAGRFTSRTPSPLFLFLFPADEVTCVGQNDPVGGEFPRMWQMKVAVASPGISFWFPDGDKSRPGSTPVPPSAVTSQKLQEMGWRWEERVFLHCLRGWYFTRCIWCWLRSEMVSTWVPLLMTDKKLIREVSPWQNSSALGDTTFHLSRSSGLCIDRKVVSEDQTHTHLLDYRITAIRENKFTTKIERSL